MKRSLPLLLPLLLLLLAGCAGVPADYLQADKGTYAAIAPEYERYLDQDETLTGQQRESRRDTLATWELRIRKAEGK